MRISTKILIVPILLAVLTAPAALAQDAPLQEEKHDNRFINWQEYSDAVERSRAENIPLLIHFTAQWCKWCEKMKRETYKEVKIIRYLNENYAMTMVDTEKLPALAAKFRVEGLPTLWFLDGKGNRLTHVPGYMSAETMLPLLEFINTKAYESGDYETWLKRRK